MKNSKLHLAALMVLVISFAVSAVAEDHYEMLPDSTMLAVTFHNADELRSFWNLPEVQQMLEMFPQEVKEEMKWSQFDSAVRVMLGSNVEEIIADLSGAMTFAITSADFGKMDFRPVMLIDFKSKSDRINEIFEHLKAADSLSEEKDMKLKHTMVSNRLVFTFDGEMSMSREGDTVVMYPAGESPSIYQKPAIALEGSSALELHKGIVGLDSGVSFYLNMGIIMDQFSAFVESSDTENGYVGTVFTTVADVLDLYSIQTASLRVPLTEGDSFASFVHAPGYDGILSDIFINDPVVGEYYTSLHADYDTATVIATRNFKDIFTRVLDRLSTHIPMINKEEVYAELDAFTEEYGVSILDDMLANMGGFIGFSLDFESAPEGEMSMNPLMLFAMFNYEFQIGIENAESLAMVIEAIDNDSPMGPSLERMDYNGGIIYAPKNAGPFSFSLGMHGGTMYMAFYDVEKMKATFDALDNGVSLAESAELQTALASVPASAMSAALVAPNYFKKYGEMSKELPVYGISELPDEYAARIDQILASFPDVSAMASYYQIRDGGLYFHSDFSIRSFLKVIQIEMVKMQAMQAELTPLEEEPAETPAEPEA